MHCVYLTNYYNRQLLRAPIVIDIERAILRKIIDRQMNFLILLSLWETSRIFLMYELMEPTQVNYRADQLLCAMRPPFMAQDSFSAKMIADFCP